ncbi:MAG: Rho termination factor N-terminal domain-containing protein [bacterium]|nr:Rho termination factor N-terminal domain-containing protein [bacterium]
MTINEVRKIAKDKGIKLAARQTKAEIIRMIQKAEGNFDCFGTAQGYCDQLNCLWREDCLK